jgi:predicted GIY-YIG superfamily endonuclease
MNPKYKRMLVGMAIKEKALVRRRLKRDWLVYILRCSDGSLYTGVTNNIERRLKMHNDGTGARYTRVRCPSELVYQEHGMTRSQALIRECAIKTMSRRQKEDLIKG